MNENFLSEEYINLLNNERKYNINKIFLDIDDEDNMIQISEKLSFLKRDDIYDVKSYLDCIKMLNFIECLIRFSIFPGGKDSPHHFSKLLNSNRTKSVLNQRIISLCLAIFADPKGLNLRNYVLHGFYVESGLPLALINFMLDEIKKYIKDFNFEKPTIDFSLNLELIKFKNGCEDFSFIIKGYDFAIKSNFPLKTNFRMKLLKEAYNMLDQKEYYNSLLYLLPLLEQSLRVYIVKKHNIHEKKMIASGDEHFFSIQDMLKYLPDELQNMINDIFFYPHGPRIRDKVLHGLVDDIHKNLCLLVFNLYERLCEYSMDNACSSYIVYFHPQRLLEYQIYMCTGKCDIDLIKENSHTTLRLVESLRQVYLSKDLNVNSEVKSFFNNSFQKLMCETAVSIVQKSPNENIINNFLILSSLPGKLASQRSYDKFYSSLLNGFKVLKKINTNLPDEITIELLFNY